MTTQITGNYSTLVMCWWPGDGHPRSTRTSLRRASSSGCLSSACFPCFEFSRLKLRISRMFEQNRRRLARNWSYHKMSWDQITWAAGPRDDLQNMIGGRPSWHKLPVCRAAVPPLQQCTGKFRLHRERAPHMLVCRKDGSLFGNREESEDESCSAESGDDSEIEDGRDSAAETKQVEEVEPSRGGHWTTVTPRRLGGQSNPTKGTE